MSANFPPRLYFYPRPPRGGRQSLKFAASQDRQFLSTPSARRATLCPSRCGLASGFLSTPSARRATRVSFPRFSPADDFYPRPPRGGRPRLLTRGHLHRGISIHALREEGDRPPFLCRFSSTDFYPRPPRGGRRTVGSQPPGKIAISIHALREEGDRFS